MAIATLKEAVLTYSIPQYIISRWDCPIDSTGLISISLPASNHLEPSYRAQPNISISGTAYVIKLNAIAISSDSTNFDIQILTKNDESAVNTIYDVLDYTSINLKRIDHSFTNFIIKNCDDTLTNKLYFKLTNNDAGASGLLDIQITYEVIQDKVF